MVWFQKDVITMLVEIMYLPTTSEIARQEIGDLKAHIIERNGSLTGHIDTEKSTLDSRFYLTDEMSKCFKFLFNLFNICLSASPGRLQTNHVRNYEAPEQERKFGNSDIVRRFRLHQIK